MRPSVAWTIAGISAGAVMGIGAGLAAANRESRERMAESARVARVRVAEATHEVRDRVTGATHDVVGRVNGTAEQWRERNSESWGRALLEAAEARDEALVLPGDDEDADDL